VLPGKHLAGWVSQKQVPWGESRGQHFIILSLHITIRTIRMMQAMFNKAAMEMNKARSKSIPTFQKDFIGGSPKKRPKL
jgi:hypothetical protein